MTASAARLLAKQEWQVTLAILKPDICCIPILCDEVRWKILDHGFHIIRQRQLQLSLSQAEQFYKEHSDRFFFTRLTSFMSSSALSVLILGKRDCIRQWRALLGPTKVTRAQFEVPHSIRGSYGISDTRNVAHGSDSQSNAFAEIAFFFPDFDLLSWCQQELPLFAANKVTFDHGAGVHRIAR